MFADLLAGAPEPLLAIAAGAVAVMWLVAWDAERARRQRVFGGGWQALQRDRIARIVPVLPAGGAASAPCKVGGTSSATASPGAAASGRLVAGAVAGRRRPHTRVHRAFMARARGSTPRRRPTLRPYLMGVPHRRIPSETEERQPFAVLLGPGAVEPDQSPHGAAPRRHAVQLPGRGRRRLVVGRRRAVPGRGARLPETRLPRRRPAGGRARQSEPACPCARPARHPRSARPSPPTRSPARTTSCRWPCSRASPSCTSMRATSPMPMRASIPRRAGVSAMPSSPCAARADWWVSSRAATCRRAGGNADGRPAACSAAARRWSARNRPRRRGATSAGPQPGRRVPRRPVFGRRAPRPRTLAQPRRRDSHRRARHQRPRRQLARAPLPARRRAALAAWIDQGAKPATINHVLAAVRGTLREAWRLGQIDAEALKARVTRRRQGRQGRPSLPARVATSMPARSPRCSVPVAMPRSAHSDSAMLALLYGCGLRRSEAVAVRTRRLRP